MRASTCLSPGAAGRAAWRRAAAVALGGAVVLLHAWLLLDRPREVAGHRLAARSPAAVQLRSLPAAPTRGASERAPSAERSADAATRPAARVAPAAPPVVERRVTRPAVALAPLAPKALLAPAADAAWAIGAHDASLPAPPPAAAGLDAPPPPIYATRIPAPAQLRYDVRRGGAGHEATLDWQVDAQGYRLRLQSGGRAGGLLDQLSLGQFDDAGLAPERLADRQRGRGSQAANFERAQARIRFSGPRWELPLHPGVQDRLSWIPQLAAIAAGESLTGGAEVALQVVGARGASSRWNFRVDAAQTLSGPLGEVSALRLVREPAHLYDLRVEVWLDPRRGWWPVRMRQTQVPGGQPVDWWLSAEPTAPAGT